MTDEQIVRGMEEIAAFKSLNLGCRQVLWFAIDLINRQKAEIEKKNTEIDILIEKKDTLQDENSELMAEVESLKDAIKDLRHEMSYMTSPNTIGDRHEMGAW